MIRGSRLEVWALGAVLAACGDGKPAPKEVQFDAAKPADAAPAVSDIETPTGVPAWRAVTDRARYLARRGDTGAVYGTLAGPTDGYRWLVDDTEGGGALAIRVALPEAAAGELSDGQRIEVAGAWAVDDERRWFWRASSVARVAAPAEDAGKLTHPPGLAVATIDAAPEGAVPASAAERGADILFAVVAAPAKPGDGWRIADEPGDDAIAWLVLPGERGAYGGQDMLADDERWPLVVGQRYTVKVARRPRRSAGLHLLNASGPPRKLK